MGYSRCDQKLAERLCVRLLRNAFFARFANIIHSYRDLPKYTIMVQCCKMGKTTVLFYARWSFLWQ